MKRWAEDVGAWFSSLRFSGFTVLIVGLVVVGALILSPSLTTFVQQQREISELRESVRLHREAVNEIDAERAKWKDPVYIRAQARDRLFFVMPGETQLNVIDDVVIPAESTEETRENLSRIEGDWVDELLGSVLTAGTGDPSPDEPSKTENETPGTDEPPAENDSTE